MKKGICLTILATIWSLTARSQSSEIREKPIAEIFTDFHYLLSDSTKTSGFSLNRAQFGYNFVPDGKFSAKIIVNIGAPGDLAPGSIPKRYALFREASISYNYEKFLISFGIVSTRIFDFQQKFWSKRYLGPEYQAIYGYGSVADLGIVIDYKINEHVKADLSLLNGEGYSNVQLDNSLKVAGGLTLSTQNRLFIRLYGDVMKMPDVWQTTLIAFAGIKNDHLSFGAETSFKSNLDLTENHDGWGLSATGSVYLSKKSEVFVRYDFSTSNRLPEDRYKWNYMKDGNFSIVGYQYTFNEYFRAALNYQTYLPYAGLRQDMNAICLNLHFRY